MILKKFGSVRVVSTEKILSIEEGLELLASEKNDWNINTDEERYACFLENGIICANCGLQACYFAIENVESKSYSGKTINLYGKTSDGADSYFTKDHIIPKSLGGPNSKANYQTMCWSCNSAKGSSLL